MPHFTCFTTIGDSVYLKQLQTAEPEAALRQALAVLPYDDGAGPFDEELEWLQRVAGGEEPVSLLPVGHCKNTWFWLEGARYEPQYLVYIVQTDVTDAA